MKKRILPAIPLAAAFAIIFSVQSFADVIFSPFDAIRSNLWLIVAALLGFALSAAVVLLLVFLPKVKKKRKDKQK